MSGADDLQQRLEYLEIGEGDRTALRDLSGLLERHAGDFVAAFYRHLLAFGRTRELLSDPEVKTRLLEKQRDYLLSLASGEFDGKYALDRLRIGETHERVGLEPGWYLGAYALYANLLMPLISEEYRGDSARTDKAHGALMKVLMLDAQLAMETYIERRERQLEHLADELAAANRQLERSYRDQTHELRETTERARAAERLASIGTLVAGLAHEIGTPMGVIQGHAEMLEASVSDERGQWRLRTIRDQIERISGIIQTLLNMARPHATEHLPVDLGDVVRGCLEFLAEKLRRRNIVVETELDPAPMIVGDHQKLQQLLLNLFLNAADAMSEGGTLTVRSSKDTGGIALHVEDTGPGMPPTQLERVFEPFFSTKPAGEGSGLGLMVAQGIAEEHGGSLTVTSETGVGTEFVARFPAPATT